MKAKDEAWAGKGVDRTVKFRRKKYETEVPRELETIGYSISDVKKKKKKYFLREWKSK